MTTDTPSVDDCRECRAGRAQVATSLLVWRCPVHGERTFSVAEAIRERDEALVEIRRLLTMTLDVKGKLRPVPGGLAYAQIHTRHLLQMDRAIESARAFLARFPEGGEA